MAGGFDRSVSSRNLANDVDDNVVDALVEAVNAGIKICPTDITP